MQPRRVIAAEAVVYLLAACAVVGAALFGPEVPGTGVDLHGSLWFHWWLPHALGEGLDPRVTDLFFHPLGKDLFAHTGMNLLDAALSAPFQLVFGHPGYLGPLTVAVLFANALAFRPLVAELAWPARVVGCLAFGWSAYTLGEVEHGRTAQACLFWVPLALACFVRAGEGARYALGAGVFTALAGWTYWFYGYFLALALAWLAVDGWRREGLRALAPRHAVAAAICLALVAPAVAPMLGAAARGEVPLLDGAGPPAPVPVFRQVFTVPMGLAVGVWAVVGRQRLRWAPVLVLMTLVAIGPHLGGVANPIYALVDRVPFAKRLAFPYRALGVAAVVLAWVLADLVDRAGRGRAVAAVLALVVVGVGARDRLPVSAQDPRPPELLLTLGEGAILDLPVASAGALVGWQPALGQPLFGGMGATNPALWPEGFAERRDNGFVQALERASAARSPGTWERTELQRLLDEGFRWVVHQGPSEGGPRSRAAARRLIEVLGEPLGQEGPLTVWDMAAVQGGS